MPTEINRKIATKTFNTSGGTVKVPVITEITFRDPVDRGQETPYTVDNSGASHRDVHVAWVGPLGDVNATENADPNTPPPTDVVAVERIDLWRVKDPIDRGQQTYIAPDNKTFDPGGPPFFKTHLKTHLVKYRKDPTNPSDAVTITSELIDEFIVKDPVDRAQETHYFLQNPQDDDAANAQITPDLPDITDTDHGVDPAYRLDPFQNIVEVSGKTASFIWQYTPSISSNIGGLILGYNFNLTYGPGAPGGFQEPPHGWHLTGAPVMSNPGGVTNGGSVRFPNTFPTVTTEPWIYHGGGPYQSGELGSPAPSVSHTWAFQCLQNALDLNSPFIEVGTLTTSIGGITLVVEGVHWPLISVSVAMFSWPAVPPFNPSFAGFPDGDRSDPTFVATFQAP